MHIQNHTIRTDKLTFSCNKCDKVYASMNKLRRHDWRSHREVECSICGKGLRSRDEISNHRKIEHNMFRKTKCKYFPNCIDEDECLFEHDNESKYCPKGSSCDDQSCVFSEVNHVNMPNMLCRFQAKCNRSECMYKHIRERSSF